MSTGSLTWPASESRRLLAAAGDWLKLVAGTGPRRRAADPRAHARIPEPKRASPFKREAGPGAAPTRLFREVATRSLGRAAFEPLPVFIPVGATELAGWMALPRDRQALLGAIAARLDAETQAHLRTLLASGHLALRDPGNRGDLLAHLAELYTEPVGPGCDQRSLLEAAIRSLARPESIRGPAWVVWLARRSPAELARLIAGLAGADGRVGLLDGSILERSPEWYRFPGDLVGRLLGSARHPPATD